MDNLLDSKQLVSGVAILLSFIAGYRYAQRNHENDSSKSETENSNTEKGRVSNINANYKKKIEFHNNQCKLQIQFDRYSKTVVNSK